MLSNIERLNLLGIVMVGVGGKLPTAMPAAGAMVMDFRRCARAMPVPPRVYTDTSWAQAHTPYTRVSVANEHKAGSRGAAPEENYEFVQFM